MDGILSLLEPGNSVFGVALLAFQGFLAYRVKALEHKFDNGINAKLDHAQSLLNQTAERVSAMEIRCAERREALDNRINGMYRDDHGDLQRDRRKVQWR